MALPASHHGRLSLEVVCERGRTAIARQRASPPLQIFGLQQDAAGAAAYLQIVNPTGGLCEGDTAEIEVTVAPGAHLYLTTQAATKIYPAAHGAMARQRTRLHVASGAVLEYFPLPLILFAGARYAQDTSIRVEPGGVCLVAEVLAPGRLARGERFAYHLVRTRVEAWLGERLALCEQMILEPPRRSPEGLGGLDGRPYLATLYVLASHAFEAWVPAWNRRLAAQYGGCVGMSELAYGGLVARVLGDTAQETVRRLELVDGLVREEGLGLPPLRVYRPYG
jgi:urease accessory protein